MFFRKRCNKLSPYDLTPIEDLRINQTEIYDKKGKDGKLLKTERTLQYRRVDDSWGDVWVHWSTPVYLEDKNG